jgi:protein TonB
MNAATLSAQPTTLPWGSTWGVAILIEGAMILGLAALVVPAVKAPEPDPVNVLFDDTPPPKAEPLKPIKPVVVKNLPVPVVKPQVVTAPQPETPPTPSPSKAEPVTVAAESAYAQPAPPPPPPLPAAGPSDKELEFAARVKAAIQAAVVYPMAAKQMGFRGKAVVEFMYRDGAVMQIRVVQSSGMVMIDNAALAAVSAARFPTPPETLKSKDVPYRVTVMFELTNNR